MDGSISRDQEFLLRLTQILDANLGRENFGVNELARAIGCSKSQLLRKLHILKGTSTSQFIREYRLRKAMDLLQENAGTASEIAYRVGFSSPSYFGTCFHEYYGYPPGEAKIRNATIPDTAGKVEADTVRINGVSKRTILVFSLVGLLLVVAVASILYLNSQSDKQEVLLPVGVADKSIAVIPFKNLSGDPEFQYVSDGMTDAIISRLAKIRSIKNVISFTTMLTYKNTDKGIAQIAGELGVTHLLEGNVQRSGDTVKVILRLIDGRADSYEWSDDYRANWNDGALFEMQARVAEKVAGKMGVQISHQEVELIKRMPTKKYEAYSHYLKAEHYMMQMNRVGLDDAVHFYEKAIGEDSTFVEAYVGMSRIWRIQAFFKYYDKSEAYQKAKYYMDKALELHPTDRALLDEYYFSLFLFDWDFHRVEKYYQNLIVRDSLFISPEMTAYAMQTNRLTDAFHAIEMAIEDDPKSLKMRLLKAWGLYWTGKNSEAISMLEEIMPLYNELEWLKIKGALLLYHLGEWEHCKQVLESFALDDRFSSSPLALVLTSLMQNEEKGSFRDEQLINELSSMFDEDAQGSPAYHLAFYFATLQDYNRTLEWLEKSYTHNEPEMRWLYVQPCFASLHQDPRFKKLLNKRGFSEVMNL